MKNPPTPSQWLARLRRNFGVQCRLDGSGRVRVKGLRKLPAAERAALFAASAELQAHLEARARRRQPKKKEKQRPPDAMEPQSGRTVVGMHVTPGYPNLSKLLYEDEVRDIRPSPRARVLQGITYGWLVGGGE